MDAQLLVYLAFLALHGVVFLLFLRLFVWKHFAERRYWRAEPQLNLDSLTALARSIGSPLPRIALLVPAREESSVIARTIHHLARLEYPPDRYEIIVVTDEKERIAAARERQQLVEEVLAFVTTGAGWPYGRAESVLVGLLARLAVARVRTDPRLGRRPLRRLLALPEPLPEELTFRAAADLWQQLQHAGRARVQRCAAAIQAALAERLGDRDAREVAAACLGLALGVVVALCRLRGDTGGSERAALPPQLRRLAERLSEGTLQAFRELAGREAQARAAIAQACTVVLPTTQEVVERCARELAGRSGVPRLKHVEVPRDFDGRLGGACIGREVPSTKGRALNYAAAFADPGVQILGFYDAEARPDRRVLLHVALRWLRHPDRPLVLQGPVFQVRNFHHLGPLNKIAALYQSISHHWYLPVLMRHLPFIGGTNFFVDRVLFERTLGFDPTCLSEDLDIGVRLALVTGAWPDYLPVPATEQTPPTFPAYFRQRLRWGCGWLQVYRRLRQMRCREPEREALRVRLLRELFLRGHVQWSLYQLATLSLPVSWWLAGHGLLDPSLAPPWLSAVLRVSVLPYLAFTWYCLARYRGYMEPPPFRGALAVAALQILLLPLAAFFFPTPFSTALALHVLGVSPTGWVKTPRTAE